MGTRTRLGLVVALALVAELGCGGAGRKDGTGGGAAGTGGSSAGAGGIAAGAGTGGHRRSLFDDPAVPLCTLDKNVALRGTLGGETIDDAAQLGTYLAHFEYSVTETVDFAARYIVTLTWDTPLADLMEIPLTGESFIMRAGQPFAGEEFCITAGVFGSPPTKPGDTGRMLLYRITGARRGDCAGPEIAVDLGRMQPARRLLLSDGHGGPGRRGRRDRRDRRDRRWWPRRGWR